MPVYPCCVLVMCVCLIHVTFYLENPPYIQEIRSLVYDGRGFVSHQVHRHDMADQLVMNSHPHPSDLCTLAVGVGAQCMLLKAKNEGISKESVTTV